MVRPDLVDDPVIDRRTLLGAAAACAAWLSRLFLDALLRGDGLAPRDALESKGMA